MAAFQSLRRLTGQACSTYRQTLQLQFQGLVAEAPRRCFSVHAPAHMAKNPGRQNKRTEIDQGSGHGKSTRELIPGSQRIAAGEEYTKAEEKMKAGVEYFRKESAALDMRASGRVTPAILSPVRVKVPNSGDPKGVRLEEIATVGVKEGTTLLVTVFEDHVSLLALLRHHLP